MTRRVVLTPSRPDPDWSSDEMRWVAPLVTVMRAERDTAIQEVGVEPDELAQYLDAGGFDRGRLLVFAAGQPVAVLDVTDMMHHHLYGLTVAKVLERHRHLVDGVGPMRLLRLRSPAVCSRGEEFQFRLERTPATQVPLAGLVVPIRFLEAPR